MRKWIGIIGSMFMGVASAQAALKVGDVAPDFSAPTSEGTVIHLKDVIGASPVVLYFYPKDDTPGCTKEACGLRDNFAAFRQLNARVFGISYDTVDSHQAFAKKYNLPFTLISDHDKTIAKKYGADGMLFAKRMTFVIDKSGKIAWINPAVNPTTHSAELQKVLAQLNTPRGLMPLLFDFQNITILRQKKKVLRSLSLNVRLGEHVAILGPNGSGKSTLIKAMTRELYPVQGEKRSVFKIFGQDLWDVFELRRKLGIVSPDLLFQLMREVTARELVLSGFFSGLGLWPHNAVTQEMERKARAVLKFLEIAHLADRPITAMSSGENRRALIGRALVHNPKALVLDEPTNSLDPKAVHEFRTVLRKVAQAGTTLVLVTHHLHDIIPEIQRVILIKEGKLFRDGPKKSVLTSSTLSTLFELPVRVLSQAGYFDLTGDI